MDSFSFDLRAWRQANGLDQTSTGHLLGWSQKKVSRFENGTRVVLSPEDERKLRELPERLVVA